MHVLVFHCTATLHRGQGQTFVRGPSDAIDRSRLFRGQPGEALLPLPVDHRLRRLPVGLDHRTQTIRRILLLRRLPLPLLPDEPPFPRLTTGIPAVRCGTLLFPNSSVAAAHHLHGRQGQANRLRFDSRNDRRQVWLRIAEHALGKDPKS